MELGRRIFGFGGLACLTFGVISQFTTGPDQWDELIRILAAGIKEVPGYLSHVIAEDSAG